MFPQSWAVITLNLAVHVIMCKRSLSVYCGSVFNVHLQITIIMLQLGVPNSGSVAIFSLTPFTSFSFVTPVEEVFDNYANHPVRY
jgi:hypothetical protein